MITKVVRCTKMIYAYTMNVSFLTYFSYLEKMKTAYEIILHPCVSVFLPIVARQRLAEHVSVAMNTHST
jgi:hypothetical protein